VKGGGGRRLVSGFMYVCVNVLCVGGCMYVFVHVCVCWCQNVCAACGLGLRIHLFLYKNRQL
jgi:hypothetical protein